MMPLLALETPCAAPTLRDALRVDRPFLVALHDAVHAHELAQVGWPPEMRQVFVQMQYDAQATEQARRYPASRCRIVELHGCPVGRLWLARTEGTLRVLDIAIVPALQGRGIGTALLRQVLHDADRMDLPIELHVVVGNPARRLFERLDFVVAGTAGVHQAMVRAPAPRPRTAPCVPDAVEMPQEQA